MQVNDLLSILERLHALFQSDNRSTPELAILLRAYQSGGHCSFDLELWASELGETPRRLATRLQRLERIGGVYCPPAGGQPATFEIVSRPRASSRAVEPAPRSAPRAAPRSAPRAAPARLLCSCSGSVLFLVSKLRALGVARVAVLPVGEDEETWKSRARALLERAGKNPISDDDLIGGAVACYSAADYLGDWETVEEVLKDAWKKLPAGTWEGWPFHLRNNLLEHLTRKTLLDSLSNRPRKREEPIPVDDVQEEVFFPPLVQSLLTRLSEGLGGPVVETWFRPCSYSVEGNTISIGVPSTYYETWIRQNYAIDLRLAEMDLGVKIQPEDLCKEPSVLSVETILKPDTEEDHALRAEVPATTNGAP